MPTTVVFGVDTSSEIVAQRLVRSGASRLSSSLVAVVEHIHQVIRELKPTRAEWREAVAYLTDIGHATDERRQEWVLLADLIGATALVEDINCRRPAGATSNTPRGPFYRSDAPRRSVGADICLDGVGEKLEVRGRITDLDGCPIAGATVETWQANGSGLYENQEPDNQPEFNLRGVFSTDAQGRFSYRSVMPGGYSVPDDGPVGQLLDALGCPLRRPAHIHFIINAGGFETITTQIFVRSEAETIEDPLFSVRPNLIGDFKPSGSKDAPWALDFTFVMARARNSRGVS